MRELKVSKKYNNKKLSNLIFDTFPNLNKNVFYRALRKKDIRINDNKINIDTIVHYEDKITIYITDNYLFEENKFNIDIVFEDENILVVNKPANISVTDDNFPTLTSILQNRYNKNIMPCHRIDRNTKGLVLFAKDSETLNILLEKFKNKEIEKHYIARTYGVPNKSHEILEAYLFKDSKKSLVYISDTPKKDYQKIVTEYTILNKNNNIAILDINLHTGKTHQIRAHLAHIGCPILGDGKYGINEINKKYNLKTQELYSYKLIFNFVTASGKLDYLNGKEINMQVEI